MAARQMENFGLDCPHMKKTDPDNGSVFKS